MGGDLFYFYDLPESPTEPFEAVDLYKIVLRWTKWSFGTVNLCKFGLNVTRCSCVCDPLWMINQTARQCCVCVIISLVSTESNHAPIAIHVWCLSPNFMYERGTPEMFPRLRVVGIFLNKNIFKILQNRVWSSGLCGGHESVVLLVCADFFVVSPCFFHAFLFMLN